MKTLLTLFIWILGSTLFSQITFQKSYGTANDESLDCNGGLPGVINTTKDSCYVGVFTTTLSASPQNLGLFFFKVDRYGDTVFAKTYSVVSDLIYAKSVQELKEGGYLIGATFIGGGVLIVTDEWGNITWTKMTGAKGECAMQLMDNSLLNVSVDYGGFMHSRLDYNGNLLSSRRYNYCLYDESFRVIHVIQCANQDVVSVGRFGFGFMVIRTDMAGNIVFAKKYMTDGQDHEATNVIELADGSLLVCGIIYNSYGFLLKTDASGNAIFFKKYGFSSYYYFSSMVLGEDGDIVLTGAASYGGVQHGHIAKIDAANGDILWIKVLLYSFACNSIRKTFDDGYIIGGICWDWNLTSTTNAYLCKTDEDCSIECDVAIVNDAAQSPALIVTDECMEYTDQTGLIDVALMTSSSVEVLTRCQNFVLGGDELHSEYGFELYPNPVQDYLNLRLDGFPDSFEITVTDLSGKIIYKDKILDLDHITIDLPKLSPGSYLVTVHTATGIYSKGFIMY